jgi:CHASE1-domain containing sensor protein
MSRTVSIMGLLLSLGALFAAYSVTPQAADVALRAETRVGSDCISREIALDEGYGVSRMETRLVCATTN